MTDEQRALWLAETMREEANGADHVSDEEMLLSTANLLERLAAKRYPFIDGPHLVLGPECFTGDGDEVSQDVISWRGENYYRRTE